MPDSATTLTPQQRVDAHDWYHTIDVAPGVTTPGWFDTRPTADIVPLPKSLAGKRCLDVGTWDGYWAFEMEKRGAESVVAIDILDEARWDWPPAMQVRGNDGVEALKAHKKQGVGYELAHEILGSKVERIDMSIYDLSPETVGMFDFVFLGSLLLHLRDPVKALDAMRTVTGDTAVIADAIDAIPSYTRRNTPTARLEGVQRPWWWIPNRAGLMQIIQSAGFEIIEQTGLYWVPTGPAHPGRNLKVAPKQLLTARGREEVLGGFKGLAHAAALVRPVGQRS